jgi:hypothetical protein
MVQVERTVTVGTPVELVAEYLSDFAHTETWDPGTVSCTRTDEYRLTRRDSGRVTFVGEKKTATSRARR